MTGVETFLGIPFAQPPIGNLRWQPPVYITEDIYGKLTNDGSAQNNDTEIIYDATEYGNTCIQFGRTGSETSESEDCLFLNIFRSTGQGQSQDGYYDYEYDYSSYYEYDYSDDYNSTSNPIIETDTEGNGDNYVHDSNSLVPVLFVIHGGSFVTGSSDSIDFLMRTYIRYTGKNVIVVTINYRLGLLGFLGGDDVREYVGGNGDIEGGAGNFGLLDQRMAMRWVHDNIHAFGGDPNNVCKLYHGSF